MLLNQFKNFMTIKDKIWERTTLKRTIFFVVTDIILISLACYLGFLLRFDGKIPIEYYTMIKGFVAMSLPIILFLFSLEKLYSISWSFISIRELLKLFRAVMIGFLTIGAILFIFRDKTIFTGFPRSIIFVSGFLCLLTTGGFRFAKRVYAHLFKNGVTNNKKNGKRVLIVGAGEAGEQLARHITVSGNTPYLPVGFVDDNHMKQNILIHGIKVLGRIKNIPVIIKKHQIKEIIIALPSASKKIIKNTVNLSREAGIQKIKILPSTAEILDEKISLKDLREISIEDLLGRQPVKIDTQAIQSYINNKTILITGAAGSIGSQLCEEIIKFAPKKIIALDQRETAIFYLEKKLNRLFPDASKIFIIADICDKNKINNVFKKHQPEIVFHAAAYKHVPMMESNPDEAIKNNIFGTLTVGQASIKNKIEKFVMVSTDKAINPTSVMGASKRICEMICVCLNSKNQTKFSAVRFGNVLDSQGNVVKIFENQIKTGGPVEVTHPEMKRYFMVTAEACLLIMQSGAIGQGGEVFVLDMGQAIKIVDLAKEMIKLAGYEPDIDIPVIYSGIRQGEKLFEEILIDKEKPTKHEKIFISHLEKVNETKIKELIQELKQSLADMDVKKMKELLDIK